jgi:hypothetical protein
MDERIICNEPGHIPGCAGKSGGDHEYRDEPVARLRYALDHLHPSAHYVRVEAIDLDAALTESENRLMDGNR